MSEASRFLGAVGQALAARGLYAAGHPARERTVSVSYERLTELQQGTPQPSFSFIDGRVVFGSQQLREMRSWEWGDRFDQAGIQRWEFAGWVSRFEWDAFLTTMHQILTSGVPNTELEVRESAHPRIRFGIIGVKGESGEFIKDDLPVARLAISLHEEHDAMRWIVERVEVAASLESKEAEAVVASLAVAMHGDSEIALPLIQLKEHDQYTAAHSMNVSVLVMGLAEYLGLGPRDVRSIGVAGLLHDLGMARVPKEILGKQGPLSTEEWKLVRRHPIHGARMLLESEPQLDLAAVVAFEHHLSASGRGYPASHYPRQIHFATKLVQVCAVYDALRTRRPHRESTSPDRALAHIEERAGSEFDADVAKAFGRMMRHWERRIVRADDTPLSRAGGQAA